MEDFHSKDLRKGRYSLRCHVYLVTAITAGRTPEFSDFFLARSLVGSLRTSDAKGLSSTLAFVVMPDHFHWLMSLDGDKSLSQVVGAVKAVTSKRAGRPLWQEGFHDRAIRREEDLTDVARYIVANPLRASLVERLGDYPHWDATWL